MLYIGRAKAHIGMRPDRLTADRRGGANTPPALTTNRGKDTRPMATSKLSHARSIARAKAAATAGNTGRVYGYARVSTLMQATEGESLDVQQRMIAGYAQMNGMKLAKVYV